MTFNPADHPEYHFARTLPTGEIAAIQKMIFTTAIVIGLDDTGYRTRFCYDGPDQEVNAILALAEWDGEGWPPGYWLKQKPEDITNPARIDDSKPDAAELRATAEAELERLRASEWEPKDFEGELSEQREAAQIEGEEEAAGYQSPAPPASEHLSA